MFNKYPYTDFHELNLDWILNRIRELAAEVEGWKATNTITYGGTWLITKQYPAWTVVVDNNYGYISKKPVPAGIAIDNEFYWENIADFSALYADLGSRVTTLENRMDAPKKTSILLGDSFGYGIIGGGAPWATGWLEYTADQITRMHERAYYHHQGVGEQLEGTVGFIGTLPFLTVLQHIKQYELTCPDDEVTDIVVFGGSNDFGSTSTAIANAIDTFCTYCYQTFPNAHIRIGCLGLNAYRLSAEVRDGYILGATRNGCEYVDDLLNLMLNPVFDSGYGHITSQGYDYCNPFICEAARTGHTAYVQTPSVDCSIGDDVSIEAGSFTFKAYLRITEKSITMSVLDSTRSTSYALKTDSKSGNTVSGHAFTMASNVYLPTRNMAFANAKGYLRDINGYTYTPVRSGHLYVYDYTKIYFNLGFPYYNTWSSAGIDNDDNNNYLVWDAGTPIDI